MDIISISGDNDLLPAFMHEDDAGCDLKAAENGVVKAGQRSLVSTGIKISLPNKYAAFVHPRSGLAIKYGITVLNSPGTIDAGYRGIIGVILYNTSATDFVYNRGDRIAQLIFQKIEQPNFRVVSDVSEEATLRGSNGFGSTGL